MTLIKSIHRRKASKNFLAFIVMFVFTDEHHVWLLEVCDADVVGVHDAEEGEQHDGEEGGDGEGDALCHPVHRHQEDQERALQKY